MQPTLEELKRKGDKVFAEAQDAIETALRIASEYIELNAQLRHSKDEFNRRHRRSSELGDKARTTRDW